MIDSTEEPVLYNQSYFVKIQFGWTKHIFKAIQPNFVWLIQRSGLITKCLDQPKDLYKIQSTKILVDSTEELVPYNQRCFIRIQFGSTKQIFKVIPQNFSWLIQRSGFITKWLDQPKDLYKIQSTKILVGSTEEPVSYNQRCFIRIQFG